MEKMIDLFDLLRHQIKDLFYAEEQIIEGLPDMIEKANNPKLVKALKEHLKVTKVQRTRLKEVQKLLNKEYDDNDILGEDKSGFFSRLFGSTEKCRAMEGLITEGEKLMNENMSALVLDAAIIASAQKIEHYEISGYGTARAYAKELGLVKVEALLAKTLKEEYFADDSLTKLAVGQINIKAENIPAEATIGLNRRGAKASAANSTTSRRAENTAVSKSSRAAGRSSEGNPTRSGKGTSAQGSSKANASQSRTTTGKSSKPASKSRSSNPK